MVGEGHLKDVSGRQLYRAIDWGKMETIFGRIAGNAGYVKKDRTERYFENQSHCIQGAQAKMALTKLVIDMTFWEEKI